MLLPEEQAVAENGCIITCDAAANIKTEIHVNCTCNHLTVITEVPAIFFFKTGHQLLIRYIILTCHPHVSTFAITRLSMLRLWFTTVIGDTTSI